MTLRPSRDPSTQQIKDAIHVRLKQTIPFPKSGKQRPFRKGRMRGKLKKHYDLTAMLPNLVTLLGLCSGLSALRFAWTGHFGYAIGAIIVAALFDTMDGALARLLNASSRFGAELDSLADFATFGVTPALIMYMVSLQHAGSLGWVFVLWFIVCGSLRLARFNTHSIEDTGTDPSWKKGFFTGTPITISSLLGMAPLVIQLGWPHQKLVLSPMIVGIWMALVGFLMISHIPTFSLKKVSISQKGLLPILIAIVVTVSAVLSHPWRTLTVILVGYILSIPLSMRLYHIFRKTKQEESGA